MLRLAIDPDTKASGWALYDDLELRLCGLITAPEIHYGWAGMHADLVIMEYPQIYQQRKWRGNPNDLVRVTAAGAEIVGRLGKPRKYFTPHGWKGNLSKDKSHSRMRDFFESVEDAASLAVLDATSQYAKEPRLDVLDACALGLWAARRGLQP